MGIRCDGSAWQAALKKSGLKIVAAVVRSEGHKGKDLGDILGVEKTGVIVTNQPET